RRKVVRLMQRGKRTVAFEFREDVAVDEGGTGVFRPAVDDAMAHSHGNELLGFPQPGTGCRHGGGDIGNALHRIGLLDQYATVGSFRTKPRSRSDAVEFALDELLKRA